MQSQEETWLLEEKYKGMESEAFHADLMLLRNGTPLAYLIGSIPFLDCTIYLDSHPLIPRTETEYWIQEAISNIRNCEDDCATVLDLCAGSGAIGVAVAKAVPEAQVDFADIDPTHLPLIQKNIEKNLSSRKNLELDTKYRTIEADLFTTTGESSRKNLELGKYDFILTNPPYIDPAIDRAETSVKMHEPHLALYGGADGMECIERIVEQAPQYLNHSGQLWIEHEPEQTASITQLAQKHGFTTTTHKDQYGTERYTILVLQ